jgi:SWI/SNF-related matrix-associated actin-dependent regulator 1 of chromatin subfamily A
LLLILFCSAVRFLFKGWQNYVANVEDVERVLGLKLDYGNGLFSVESNIIDNSLVRHAGFAFDRDSKRWVTPFRSVAEKVVSPEDNEFWSLAKILARWEQELYDLSFATECDFELPVPHGLELYPFQKAGAKWITESENTLLADEMGLGKTVQVIAACNLLREKRVLIICPATLKSNWAREWKTWSTLERTVGICVGSSWPATEIVICNYDILARHSAEIRKVKWDMVVFDEAHYMKNPKVQRTKNALGGGYGLSRSEGIKAARKVAITGTPIVNRPIEIFPAIHYLDPFAWPSQFDFGKRYCDGKQTRWGWDFSGATNLEELQFRLRSRLMIRRLKSEVLKDLPPKTRQIIEIDPDTALRKELKAEKKIMSGLLNFLGLSSEDEIRPDDYEKVVEYLSNGKKVFFEDLSTMRKEVALRKVPFVVEHLAECLEAGKVVCFAHHMEVVKKISEAFQDRCVVITGSTSMRERNEAVKRFQESPEIDLFIGNIQAAGVGITLTASNHVVFAELDWVPGNVSQAEDRCHRIGAKGNVLVQHLVMSGSLDAVMAKAIVAKQQNIKSALDLDGWLLQILK